MPRFNLGAYMKRKKDLRQTVMMKGRDIEQSQSDIIAADEKLEKTRKKLEAKIHQQRRLDMKVR